MSETVIANSRQLDKLAAGYIRINNSYGLPTKILKNGRLEFHPAIEGAGGGLATTSLDLAKFFYRLANGRLLNPKMLNEAFKIRNFQVGDQKISGLSGYGLGIAQFRRDGAIGHPGYMIGYRVWLKYYPKIKVSTALMLNTSDKKRIKPGFKEFSNFAEDVLSRSLQKRADKNP